MEVNQRTFMAKVGDLSTGQAGPDALILDLDHIINVLKNIDDDNITSLSTKLISISKGEGDTDKTYLTEDVSLNEFLNLLAKKIVDILGRGELEDIPEMNLESLRQHAVNSLNPHNVTASQVGAYTKEEINSCFTVSNASVNYEVFMIESITDSSFTYKDIKGVIHTGEIDGDGYFIFKLKGVDDNGVMRGYKIGANSIEGIINDALIRTKASGGLKEVVENEGNDFSRIVGLEGLFVDCEVTFKYYSLHNFYSTHAITHLNASDELVHIGSTSMHIDAKIAAPIWFDTNE